MFDPANGSKAEHVTVPDGALASPPTDNPKRDGYRFDGWSEHDRIMDFRTPVTRDITLKAKWIPVTEWALSPNHGPASVGTSITITPPSADSPSFSILEAHGDKLIGVTGDGRLFTWTTNDKKPAQEPLPRDTSGDVRFTSGVVGENGYAALSRDHRIYIWSKSGETPALLDTDSTTYTSIAIAADRLMAVSQEGCIQTWTRKGDPTGKAVSLPKQALAVKAAGNADRLLALDSKGQVWIGEPDAIDTNQIQPVKLANRIVQISAMDHGFILLDSTGQTSYLENEQTQTESLALPDHSALTAISINTTQAALVDSNGRVWAWKPGEAPKRADKEEQAYAQAASTGSRITAISRQGDIYRWNLDSQNNPDKPAQLDTFAAPTLVSANMDGQALTLSRNNGSWQADIPARKPGPAAILITGKQDGQPFTRNLKYTVDQTLTRGTEPRSTPTVHFDTGGGKPEPADQHFPAPNGRVKRPSPDPTREGFLFDGWFIGEVAYDFSKPVDKNLTLTAKWMPASRNNTWSIIPDKGSQLGRESTTITPPDSTSRGIRFSQISGGYSHSLAVGSDGNAYAWGDNQYGQLGNGTGASYRTTPVRVKTPDRNTYPDLPEDFTYLQVSAGYDHSLALGSDGNAYAWGLNSDGELGDGTKTDRTTPVRVKTPDRSTYPDLPEDFTYVQVSAGFDYSLAVGSDGNAYAWGYNSNYQLGDGTTIIRQTTPVRVKTPDRKAYPDLPEDFAYLQVSAGGWHSLALGSDGNVYAWGLNDVGELGNGTTSTRQLTPIKVGKPAGKTAAFTYVQVSAGWRHSLAVGSDGNAYAWGLNSDGELGDGTTTERHTPVRVKTPDRKAYPDLPEDFAYLQVSAGWRHSLAVGSDGNAYAWGLNGDGELGDGTTTERHTPVRVKTPDRKAYPDLPEDFAYLQVSAGGSYSMALGSDGNAYAWGDNNSGQLGNGSILKGGSSLVPVPVSFNLQLVITGVKFDSNAGTNLTRSDGSSVTVLTPAHQPGTVTVSVDYTLGGAPQQPDTSLRYTYLPAGVLPKAGGEGILLALATGMTGMGGVLASRRHRQETRQLSHASHE
nr:InlB B-repeat-containing protein [Bifidobacterium asteroides]